MKRDYLFYVFWYLYWDPSTICSSKVFFFFINNDDFRSFVKEEQVQGVTYIIYWQGLEYTDCIPVFPAEV